MQIKVNAIQNLIDERFRGKLSYFVVELNVDYSYMNQIMNKRKPATSKKVCEKVIKYCKENNLDYNQYIFF